MHICPAEIAAALLALEQATIMYWYAKMRVLEFSNKIKNLYLIEK